MGAFRYPFQEAPSPDEVTVRIMTNPYTGGTLALTRRFPLPLIGKGVGEELGAFHSPRRGEATHRHHGRRPQWTDLDVL